MEKLLAPRWPVKYWWAMHELPDADEDIIELRALRYLWEPPWTGPRRTAWERLLVTGPLE